MTFGAVDHLYKFNSFGKVFEWGSGGSKLFFSKICKSIISTEYDEKWFSLLEKKLTYHSRVKYDLIKGEEWVSNPEGQYTENMKQYTKLYWEKYTQAFDTYDNYSFDTIIVDGRARPSCIAHFLSKLKKEGVLIFDNSERVAYRNSLELLSPSKATKIFPCSVFFDTAFSQTSIFEKA
jgi:hypothetical protein